MNPVRWNINITSAKAFAWVGMFLGFLLALMTDSPRIFVEIYGLAAGVYGMRVWKEKKAIEVTGKEL